MLRTCSTFSSIWDDSPSRRCLILFSLIETIPGLFSGKHLQENLYLRVQSTHVPVDFRLNKSMETTKQSDPEYEHTKESPTVSTEDHLRFQGLDAQAGPLRVGYIEVLTDPRIKCFLVLNPPNFQHFFWLQ